MTPRPPGPPEPPPRPDPLMLIMQCRVCGQDWDEWHQARVGRAVWSTSCRVDRAVSEWWARMVAGFRAQGGRS